MERTLAKDAVNSVGKKISLKGWVNTKRDHNKIVFIDLRDRSGMVQVVFWGETVSAAKSLGPEDAIAIEGLVKERSSHNVNPDLETGTVEIEAQTLHILSTSAELPLDMGKEDLDVDISTLLDYRSLSFRHPKIQAIFKVQAVIIDAFRKSLIAKDFLEFQAPSIINAVPEGGAEVFKVKYFDTEAYLSQSPQLYKSLLTTAFERVFSVNQIFRAEPSSTTRHLTEATSLDAEFNFLDSWEEVQEIEEYVVRSILKEVAERCQKELALFKATLPTMSDKFPILKLREAQEIIFQRTGRDCRQEKDLSPEDEREICTWAKEQKGSDLIFISHFPTKKKPFYVYPDPADPEYAYSVDLLCRGVEWSSGGQRLNDFQNIQKNVKDWGIKEEDVALYLQAFKYGSPQLGGFALGAERMTMYILGLKNIREASMFPRDMERIDTRLSVNK